MNLSDLVGSSKGVPFYSAEMADGVNTIAIDESRGVYTPYVSQRNNISRYSMNYGIVKTVDTKYPEGAGLYEFTMAQDGEDIYILNQNNTNFYKYNMENNVWTLLSSLDVRIRYAASFVYDGKIYIPYYNDLTNDNYGAEPIVYDIANDSWSRLTTPDTVPDTTTSGSYAFDGQYIYFNEAGSTEIDRYDCSSNSWELGYITGQNTYAMFYASGYLYCEGGVNLYTKIDINTKSKEVLFRISSISSNKLLSFVEVGDVIYFGSGNGHQLFAYNKITKEKQIANLGSHSPCSYTSYNQGHFYSQALNKIVIPMPFSDYTNEANSQYSDNVALIDITKPHFYNLKV